MKAFLSRVRCALNGIRHGLTQPNFRIQHVLATGALLLLVAFRPAPAWWALFLILIAGVLSAELFNTAIEALSNAVHPEYHPLIGVAKDCAAGAVLIWSFASLAALAAFVVSLAIRV